MINIILWSFLIKTGSDKRANGHLWSRTFNIPLDNRFQDSCLDAANTQINLQKQELNAKLLNYEIARLKNCGELMLKGIYFDPKSNFAKLCEGVMIAPKPNQVIPHTHEFKVGQ